MEKILIIIVNEVILNNIENKMLKQGSKSLRDKYAVSNTHRKAKGTTSFPNFTQTVK